MGKVVDQLPQAKNYGGSIGDWDEGHSKWLLANPRPQPTPMDVHEAGVEIPSGSFAKYLKRARVDFEELTHVDELMPSYAHAVRLLANHISKMQLAGISPAWEYFLEQTKPSGLLNICRDLGCVYNGVDGAERSIQYNFEINALRWSKI